MSEKTNFLEATTRKRLGSRDSKRIRDAGGLPAVVYGAGRDPRPIYLPAKEAIRLIEKGEKVYQMGVDGKAPDEHDYVLLRDIQFDYLGTNIVHADFSRVKLTDRVLINAPLHLVGDAPGLKTEGAILLNPLDELELECQVSNIPEYIEVDVSELETNHSITAGEIKLPKPTMVLKTDPDAVVCNIVIQQEIMIETDEEATAVAQAAPELVGAESEGDEGDEGQNEGEGDKD